MVLRCSLLGHDFGETDVEREREERGSEVVVTVQEYEECSRCGQRNVISENTEVTSLSAGTRADSLPDDHEPHPTEPPIERDTVADSATDIDSDAAFIDAEDADPASEDAELVDSEPDASAAPNSPAGSAADPTDDVAAAADAGDVANPADETAAATGAADASDDAADEIELPTDENGDPVTDDGEILEDDDDSATDRNREHGEWPDSSDVGPPVGADDDPTEWPDDADGDGGEIVTETDDGVVSDAVHDGADSTQPDDDAVVLENDAPAGGTGDARSVTAEAPAAEHGDADAASESGTGIERADSVATPAESDDAPGTDVPTEFYCPRCDYVAAGDRGSLRAGDICPDCRKGYISERERQ